MQDLSIFESSGWQGDGSPPPTMTGQKMLRLSLRTWPFMRPMLPHLLVLLAFAAAGALGSTLTFFVGTDLFTNKVLLGQKLQPFQAVVLFLPQEYVGEESESVVNKPESESGASDAMSKGPSLPFASGKGGETEGSETQDVGDYEPELTEEQRRTVRNRLLILTMVGSALAAVVFAAFWYYTTWIWQSINQNLRVAMVERAESLSLRYHDSARVGDAIFRVYQDSAMIINLLQSGIFAPLWALFGIVMGLAVVAAFDPWFSLMVLVTAVPVIWLIVAATPRIRRRALVNREANSDLTSRTQEAFAAIKVVKANRAESRVLDRFSDDSMKALDAAYYLRLDVVILTATVTFLAGSLFLLSEYLMVSWIRVGRETFLGAAFVFIIGFTIWNLGALQIARGRVQELVWGARGMVAIWMRVQDLFVALERAFYLLDIEPEVVEPESPEAFPHEIEEVSWEGVTFGYHQDQQVLSNISLSASKGTVTAIVGSTGSGKSTLMSLLLRIYDPDAGSVKVNDVDLRDMATDDIRAHVSIALQKNVLFNDTVANNIAFGSTITDQSEIESAAKIACADGFIKEMGKGYQTELGERGGKLSAGQRQRLSIARAVVRDTPILILDEPTASLDARTEQEVMKNLAEWGRDRVIFLITHRLSTIRQADQIALIENGVIVETGTHHEMMDQGLRYAAFVNAETAAYVHDHGKDSTETAPS